MDLTSTSQAAIEAALALLQQHGYVVSSHHKQQQQQRGLEEGFATDTRSIAINCAAVFGCLFLAFLAAGLTMGLLSIDPLEIAIKQVSWTQPQPNLYP
jgi:hypothetical protein